MVKNKQCALPLSQSLLSSSTSSSQSMHIIHCILQIAHCWDDTAFSNCSQLHIAHCTIKLQCNDCKSDVITQFLRSGSVGMILLANCTLYIKNGKLHNFKDALIESHNCILLAFFPSPTSTRYASTPPNLPLYVSSPVGQMPGSFWVLCGACKSQ